MGSVKSRPFPHVPADEDEETGLSREFCRTGVRNLLLSALFSRGFTSFFQLLSCWGPSFLGESTFLTGRMENWIGLQPSRVPGFRYKAKVLVPTPHHFTCLLKLISFGLVQINSKIKIKKQ